MRMKALILLAALAALAGCGRTHEVKMVHPETKASADCVAHGAGFIDRMTAAAALDDCIEKYEAQGYVRQDTQ